MRNAIRYAIHYTLSEILENRYLQVEICLSFYCLFLIKRRTFIFRAIAKRNKNSNPGYFVGSCCFCRRVVVMFLWLQVCCFAVLFFLFINELIFILLFQDSEKGVQKNTFIFYSARKCRFVNFKRRRHSAFINQSFNLCCMIVCL